MKNLIILSLFIMTSCSVGPKGSRQVASTIDYQHPMSYNLASRIEDVTEWMSECPADSAFAGQISDRPNKCDQGDVMSWAGYTCLAVAHTGNTAIKEKRCRDVGLAQGANGRWWRGQSRIETQTSDSFSRDMSLGVSSYLTHYGVLSDNIIEKKEAVQHLSKWIEYIEREGKGKYMCNDGSDNRCHLFGGAGHLVYVLAEKMGLLQGALKDYKFIKDNKNPTNKLIWLTELQFTPVGFQLHLKAQELLVRKNLGIVSDDDFMKYAKIFYRKDPNNPLYEFLYTGATEALIERVMGMCPSTPLPKDEHVVYHNETGDWAWQRDSMERTWEIANGHDCIFMMSYLIADLEGRFKIPVKETGKARCHGKSSYLGSHLEKDVCRSVNPDPLSEVECIEKHGTSWESNGAKYCLLNKSYYWRARKMGDVCPAFYQEEGELKDKTVCRNKLDKNIRLYQCVKKNGQVEPQWSGEVPHTCYSYRGEWFEKQAIKNECPLLHPYQGELIWGAWPVCKGLKKIKKSECVPPYMQARDNHCLIQKDGWFSKQKYK